MRIADRESDVLAACLQYLAVKGVFAWRHNQGAIPRKGGGYRRFVGLRGVSDILGILPQRAEVVGEGMVRFGNLSTKYPATGMGHVSNRIKAENTAAIFA